MAPRAKQTKSASGHKAKKNPRLKTGRKRGRPKGSKNRSKLYDTPVPPPPPVAPPTVPYDGPPEDEPLTLEEERFVANYLIDTNATRAYHETFPGCSYRTASVGGCRLVARPNIAAEIRQGQEALCEKFKVRAEDAIQEVIRCAFSDLVYVVDAQNCFLPLRKIPVFARRAIQSVKIRRERVVYANKGMTVTEQVMEYKMVSKLDALDRLCNYLGIRTTGIPDLEAVLNMLPSQVAERLRAMIAEAHKSPVPSANGHQQIPPKPEPVEESRTVPELSVKEETPDGV